MDVRWTALDAKLVCLVMLIGIRGSCGLLDSQGLALLEFPDGMEYDGDEAMNELGDHHLKSELRHFKIIGLRGRSHAELAELQMLKHQPEHRNKFESSVPVKLEKYICDNRKFGLCFRRSSSKQLDQPELFGSPINELVRRFFSSLQLLKFRAGASHSSETQAEVSFLHRRLIQDFSNRNLAAAPASHGPLLEGVAGPPLTHSSGAVPAVPRKSTKKPSAPVPSPSPGADAAGTPSTSQGSFERIWKYVLIVTCAALLYTIVAILICMCRSRAVVIIGPRKTGISGQLQKAFVTGVPNLNRSELEIACEEFSNIIDVYSGCVIYKGTLSSGVEIAVVSASVASDKHWSDGSESYFRKKVETLSRVNHKNFINLIGYCQQDDPFTRMMVFEYAPNGTLSEHLHVKEVEDLDWNARMRIIMGTAYCLQYMHDLKPPVSVTNFTSEDVFLTDDYAAKIADTNFWANFMIKNEPWEDEEDTPSLPPVPDPETNVYSFGTMLLEIISGRHLTSENGDSIVSWASEYFASRESISAMVDPTLESFKISELEVICDVIQDCLEQEPIKRPTMTEVIAKLRKAIAITPDAAIPNLSPLWWAELEILSMEAS